jgi:hypothetical protein
MAPEAVSFLRQPLPFPPEEKSSLWEAAWLPAEAATFLDEAASFLRQTISFLGEAKSFSAEIRHRETGISPTASLSLP